MTPEDLERLRVEFRPSTDFFDFPVDHVDFDSLTGRTDAETRIVDELTQAGDRGRIAVIGPSGSGKSSLMASTLARLPPDEHVALIIEAGNAGEALRDSGRFARFVVEQISQQIGSVLEPVQRQSIKDMGVTRRTVETGGQGFDVKLQIPHVPVQIAAQLRNAITSTQTNPGTPTLTAAMDRIITIIGSNNRRPVLVLDDTDKWAGSNDGAIDVDAARDFFSHGVRLLAQQDCDLVVAVHDRFLELQPYRDVSKYFSESIRIPSFVDPRPPLTAIIARRLKNAGMAPDVEALLSTEALTFMEAAYGERAQDLRYVLRILHEALLDTIDSRGDRIDRTVMYAAAQRVRSER